MKAELCYKEASAVAFENCMQLQELVNGFSSREVDPAGFVNKI
jgi:hypothetical protein